MTTIDIELNLSEEDCAVRDMAHKFAEEVVRPAGIELDRLVDPADVIAPDSVLWKVFEKYHELGLGALMHDIDSSYAQRKKKYPPWEKLQVEVHTRIANSE